MDIPLNATSSPSDLRSAETAPTDTRNSNGAATAATQLIGGAIKAGVTTVVGRPVQEATRAVRSLFMVRAVWKDMTYRVGWKFHQATLVFAFCVLILAAVYGALVEVEPDHSTDGTSDAAAFRGYIVTELALIAFGAFAMTFQGIAVENVPMLVAGNFLTMLITGRVAIKSMIVEESHWVLLGFFAAVAFGMAVCSTLAYTANGGFRRFIFFAIGGDGVRQHGYRTYAWWQASSLLDLLLALLVSVAVFYYSSHDWWQSTVFAVLSIFSIALHSWVRSAIRTERYKSFLWLFGLVFPAYAVLPIIGALTLWIPTFFHVSFSHNAKPLVVLSIICFIVTRVLTAIALIRCWLYFGKGMDIAFANEKGIADFFKATYAITTAMDEEDKAAANGGEGGAVAGGIVVDMPSSRALGDGAEADASSYGALEGNAKAQARASAGARESDLTRPITEDELDFAAMVRKARQNRK